jgi:hypothetical protein
LWEAKREVCCTFAAMLKLQPAFFAQALHQPVATTCLPAKKGQPPAASLALPWNSWQLPQFCAGAMR